MMPMPPGPLVAPSTNSYHVQRLEEAVAGIARAGFGYVELAAVHGWTEHVDLEADPAPVRRLLADAGLTALSLSAHSDLTTQDGRDYLLRALSWSSEMGIRVVNTSIGGHASTADDRGAFISGVSSLAEAARRANVIIALETHGTLMGSGRDAIPLLDEIGSEWIRLNYDTANVEFYAGVKAVDDLPPSVGYVACLHLKDHVGGKGNWNFPALGDGTVDFSTLFGILRDAGYAGPMGVEIEFWGEPWPPSAVVDYAMERSFRFLQAHGLV